MSWYDGARARLHLLFARRAAESRIADEVAFHIDMETERLVRDEGLVPNEARRRALAAFGGTTRHTESLREGRGLSWVNGLSLDFKLALRMLVKHPALTLVSVLGMSVAVTIGAVSFSAISTITNGELPVSEGDRVISIRNLDTHGRTEGRRTHLHDLATWRASLTSVDELGAYRIVDRNLVTANAQAIPVRIAEMTASGFRIARVPPLLGRYFNDDDERPGAAPVVIIGYDLWQSRFGARPDVIGQTIQLGDTRHTVVGVMPEAFAFPVNNSVWTPLRLNPADYDRGLAPSIEVFGRLAPNATIADARREAAVIGQRLASAYPQTHADMRTRVLAYTRAFIDNPEALWTYDLVQLLVTMLLVVIGTNVAILVYARTTTRMGEIAIRTALGASRARVVTQLFAEALAMSAMASVVGLVGAQFAVTSLEAAIRRIQGGRRPFWLEVHITPSVVLYCAGLAVLGAVIIGVVPALKATRQQVRSNLEQLSSGRSGMRLGKTWTFLIVSQVTVAVAVLPVAIAGVAWWKRFESARAAAATKRIVSATLYLDRPDVSGQRAATNRTVFGKLATPGAMAPDSVADANEAAARYVQRRATLARRLAEEPGVTAVAFASSPPGAEPTSRVEVDSVTVGTTLGETAAAATGAGTVVEATRVDLGYFKALDIPVLAGRAFRSADLADPTSAVIVNRSFVRKLLAGGNLLGRRVRVVTRREGETADAATASPWEEIVGVVPDFPVDSGAPDPKVYRPLLPRDGGPGTIVVRLERAAPATFTNRLRELAVATDPMLRLESIKSLEQTIADESAPTRLTIVALELVTLSTVLLSAAGIYALMSFTITRRRREIGIRSALGAGPRRVLAGVLSRVFAQVTLGIVIGIGLAGVIDRLLEGGWTGRRGALVLPAVAALMAVVGLLAAVGPARHALRIQPTEALKSE
jgi:hypothetical protein